MDRDVLLYRAHLILKKFRVVLVELWPSSEPESLAMLITFLFNSSRKEAVVTDLDSLKSGNVDVKNNASVHR